MNWTLAIDRNREALLRLLSGLFAMAGLAPGSAVPTLPRHVRYAILRVLRPAESATRRLIAIAARGLTLAPRPASLPPANPIPRGRGEHVRAFPLFDPRKSFVANPPSRRVEQEPRLSIPGLCDPVFAAEQPPSPEDSVGAERLCRRLESLQTALDDLPRQARRLARRSAQGERVSPLRPGWPPGHRMRPDHAVDTILSDCHALARYAMEHGVCKAGTPILKPG